MWTQTCSLEACKLPLLQVRQLCHTNCRSWHWQCKVFATERSYTSWHIERNWFYTGAAKGSMDPWDGLIPKRWKFARQRSKGSQDSSPSTSLLSSVWYPLLHWSKEEELQADCPTTASPEDCDCWGPWWTIHWTFRTEQLYNTLAAQWYWEKMYTDVESYCKSCPQCVIVSGCGRENRPLSHPIPVQCPFQIIGVDIMDLQTTQQGSKHVVIFQDFSKWPLVFPVSDQK